MRADRQTDRQTDRHTLTIRHLFVELLLGVLGVRERTKGANVLTLTGAV